MLPTDDRFSQASSAYLQTFKVTAIVIAVCLASFYLLSSILLPIIFSFTLYTLVEPLSNHLVRRNINHSVAIILILILMMTLSILAISFALPPFIEQVVLLKDKLPFIFSQIENLLNVYSARLAASLGIEFDLSSIVVSVVAQSASLGNALLVAISEQVFTITLSMILVPVMTYFILKDFKSLRNELLNWLPNSSFELGWLIYHRVTRQLQIYTRGVMLQSLIMSIVATIGYTVVGLDIPVLLGVLTGLLNLIPYIGPVISMFLATLVASAMTPFDPSLIYLAIGVVVFAQIVDNVVVIPSLIANAVDLHPVLAIVGILVFGNLFGAIGVILAIPAMAAIKIIHRNLYADIHNSGRISALNAPRKSQ